MNRPKFVLVDHSLHRPGGHHFDYAIQVLDAAERAGYQIIVAANRRCQPAIFQRPWQVLPLFRHHAYCQYSVLSGRSPVPCNPFTKTNREPANPDNSLSPLAATLERFRSALRSTDQRLRAYRYARACTALFSHISLEPDDQVFLPTISDFDLVGLSLFVRHFPDRATANWHAQFHFNFLEGNQANYARQQERIARMSRHFHELLEPLQDMRLHLYATTPELVQQYNLLEAAPFQLLKYPVNPAFRGRAVTGDIQLPLRILCAGGQREEKGSHELVQLVQRMKALQLGAGKLQFWVQAKRPSRIAVPETDRYVLENLNDQPPPSALVVCVPHPLPPDDYQRLLCSAHAGLFLYDPLRYYSRCSGILVELLTAGVPVIVPDGCWLGEQLADPAASGVGLVFTSAADVPQQLAKLAKHYDSFAVRARQHAPQYYSKHSPDDVIATLQQSAAAGNRCDRRAA